VEAVRRTMAGFRMDCVALASPADVAVA